MCGKIVSVLLLSSLLITSCGDTDRKEGWGSSDGMYATYSIWGEEDKELATVFFQFQKEGSRGMATSLKHPSKIFLDGTIMTADSAKETGAFYELQIPSDDFAGVHKILFIDEDKTEYEEEFLFRPFSLKNVIADSLKRKDLVLYFEGLPDSATIRVVITDTALDGEGINEEIMVKNNQLDLRKLLPVVANGPIMMQLFREEEKLLNKSYGKALVSLRYSLKREFELKD